MKNVIYILNIINLFSIIFTLYSGHHNMVKFRLFINIVQRNKKVLGMIYHPLYHI